MTKKENILVLSVLFPSPVQSSPLQVVVEPGGGEDEVPGRGGQERPGPGGEGAGQGDGQDSWLHHQAGERRGAQEVGTWREGQGSG